MKVSQHTRDTEVYQLRAQVHKRDDEVNHLRMQLKAATRNKSPTTTPKRRGRVSTDLFSKGPPSTIELSLDPAPLPNESPAVPTVAANPVLEAFAAKMGMDVTLLTEFMAVMKLANGNDAQVVGTTQKTNRRKPKPKAEIKKAVAPESKELVNRAHVSKEPCWCVERGSPIVGHDARCNLQQV